MRKISKPNGSAKIINSILLAVFLVIAQFPNGTVNVYAQGPSTAVLDNFNRTNGSIGGNWSGYASVFNVASNQLDVSSGGYDTYIFWNGAAFGTDQEAYFTFSQVDAVGPEQSIFLKSQSNTSYGDGAIEVLYDANGDFVQVWTFSNAQGWAQQGANIPVTFVNGDQFGARAKANGMVEVYRNGTLLGSRDAASWTYAANGGYIGLWFVNGDNAVLDNFGGGTVIASGSTNTPLSSTPTSIPTGTSTNTSTPTSTFVPTAGPTQTRTQTPVNTPSFTPINTATPSLIPSTATSTPTRTATFTPTLTATEPADLIFKDGFESGNFSAWTTSASDNGSLIVSTSATLMGGMGLSANINDNNAIYVRDDLPNAETRYRVRFYFDPNSIAMSNGNAHYLFYGYSGASTGVVRVEFRRSSNTYRLRASLVNDGTTWTNTNWFTIADAQHFVELDWRASSAVGANNGGLTFWIDGTQRANLTGVDNDTRRIDHSRLGAVAGIDTATRGTEYLDAFEARRTSYIGPEIGAPPTPALTVTATTVATNTPAFTVTIPPTSIPTGTSTPGSVSTTFFPIGPGGSDVIPHQIVRTNADFLYIFANQQSSSTLRVYRTTSTGLPNITSAFAAPITFTETSNIISVDAIYDGGTIIHTLINTQSGQIKDYPFDTSTNSFKPAITLTSDGGTIGSGLYVGTSGVAGMVDLSGTLHVTYWTNSNHILHRAYTYNSSSNTLTPLAAFFQVDTAGNANHPAVAVSSVDNSLTVAWVSQSDNPARIRTRTRASNGTWDSVDSASAASVWTSPDNGLNIDQGPSLLIDSSGTKHMVYIESFNAAFGDYGRIHYVTNTGPGWVDSALNVFTHDPAMALSTSGNLYIIGHGHPKNTTGSSQCISTFSAMDNMCYIRMNMDGSWGNPTLFAMPPSGSSFDASPSVKWSAVGFNRSNAVEFIFFVTPYDSPTIYYGRLP